MRFEYLFISIIVILIAMPLLFLITLVLYLLIENILDLIEIIFPINYSLVKWLLLSSIILYFLIKP